MMGKLSNWRRKRQREQAIARVPTPVEYLIVQDALPLNNDPPPEFAIKGYIPRQSAEECGFVDHGDKHEWFDKDVSERMRAHPLWVSPEEWDAATPTREGER